MEIEDLARELEHTVNCMGSSKNLNFLADKMVYTHRTLNQSFVGGFAIPFIRTMAKQYENGYYDKRNETACQMCKVMFDALCDKYPYMKDNAELPFV